MLPKKIRFLNICKKMAQKSILAYASQRIQREPQSESTISGVLTKRRTCVNDVNARLMEYMICYQSIKNKLK